MKMNNNNGTKKVIINSDVYYSCLAHAFSNESEEVMGLCLGEVDEINMETRITSISVLIRSDKRPDRVEISPEQQLEARAKAERIAEETNKPIRVVGWYHSHPHITVWPSHVDIRTQANYQALDKSFVGLIFSVFNEDSNTKLQKTQLICFQSEETLNRLRHVEIPIEIESSTLETKTGESGKLLIDLYDTLNKEEREMFNNAMSDSLDPSNAMILTNEFSSAVMKQMQIVGAPILQVLKSKLENGKRREIELKKLLNRHKK